MLRRLGLLVATSGVTLTAVVAVAGPAAAVAPPPSDGEHDCRIVSVCWPGQHHGWVSPPRNIGG